jgi:hypothetical protein
MNETPRPRLLERLARLSRHPIVWLALAALVAFCALLAHVRGTPVAAPEPARLRALLTKACDGPVNIDGQDTLDLIALIASSLVREEGVTPGPFHVLFLPRLDLLEKFHHAMHGPFTGIRAMYCDVWVNSVVPYGAIERTWGPGDVVVRPALKLPILLFLMDRLGRGQTALGEYLSAPYEAVAGMSMHTLPGRARLWQRVLAATDRHPELGEFVRVQLSVTEAAWTDSAEVRFWSAMSTDATRAHLTALAGGGEVAAERTEPARWAQVWRALVLSGGGEPLREGIGAPGEQRQAR